MPTLLFVCTGNTCRSPMAAAIAGQLLGGRSEVVVRSAGVSAGPGVPASEQALQALAARGLDLGQHRSNSLTPELIREADLILTMTEGHRQHVLRVCPEARHKVYTLTAFAGEGEQGAGIQDPYGGSLAEYQACSQQLEACIGQALDRWLLPAGDMDQQLVPVKREQAPNVEWCSGRDDQVRIALGSDHAGYLMKELIKNYLESCSFSYQDWGTCDEQSVDYPDYAILVGEAILRGEADMGILICGSGIGISITANKIPGIRAALCHEPYSARLAREHNDANVLALGSRITGSDLALQIVATWLTTAYTGGRHDQRLAIIAGLEQRYCGGGGDERP